MAQTKKTTIAKPVSKPAHNRTFTGQVTSVGMQKTIVVRVNTMKMNEKYQKRFRVSTKFHVHDEKNEAKVGDTVQFIECRPLSKTKRWYLATIVK